MLKISKRARLASIAVIMLIILLATLTTGCGGNSENNANNDDGGDKGKKMFFSLGTGGTGGVYYPLGASMGKVIADSIPNLEVTAEATGASVENLRLLESDDVQLAMVFANVAYDAFVGRDKFEKPIEITNLMTIYPTPIQIVVPAESPIQSVADFKGKKIGVGSPGSGNEVISRVILESYGLTYDDIKPEYLSIAEIMNGIKDGTVDAGISCTAVPTSTIMDLATSRKIRLIDIPKEDVDKIAEESPFFYSTTIPDDGYPGVKGCNAATYGNLLVCRADMDEELAYNIVKAMFDNKGKLEAAHQVIKQMTLEAAPEDAGIPLHPGAEKYFKEMGVLK